MSFEARLVELMHAFPDRVFVSQDEIWHERDGERHLVEHHVAVIVDLGARVIKVPETARNALGYVSPVVRCALPVAGYTRHTLGDREAARDCRRSRAAAPAHGGRK